MSISQACPIAVEVAHRIREARTDLAHRWLERIAARVRVDEHSIFPSDALLDHIPILMVGIADYIEDPQDEITADVPVIAKAMELGELRFSQGFDATEILKEYELLGGVLFAYCSRVLAESTVPCTPQDLLVCSHRMFRAISVIEQVTTAHYLRVLNERVAEREERLRRFSRMITHELKNRVGATLGAAQLLQEEWLSDAERRRFAGMVEENSQQVQKVLENLVALSPPDSSRRRQRNIRLHEAVREVFRQLRDLARGRQVHLRIADDLPDVEVSAAAVELCLSNYVSNAIKYSDPAAPERWAEVRAGIEAGPAGSSRLVVAVRDNGRGVAPARRDRLFERFYRAHDDLDAIDGTGLGLNLVRETVESLGGEAWVEFDDERGHTAFAFAVPCAHTDDGELSSDASATSDARPRTDRDAARAQVSD